MTLIRASKGDVSTLLEILVEEYFNREKAKIDVSTLLEILAK